MLQATGQARCNGGKNQIWLSLLHFPPDRLSLLLPSWKVLDLDHQKQKLRHGRNNPAMVKLLVSAKYT